jgi:hypothetical protein
MKTSTIFLLFAPLLWLASCSDKGGSPSSLSDKEAKRILLDSWNQPSIGIALGNIQVAHGLSGRRDPANRLFNQEDMHHLGIWADVGIISLKIQKDLTQEEFSWDNWNRLTQGGVAQEVSVSLTELGKKLNESKDSSVLMFPEARFTIEKITSKEFKEVDFDKYCLITGLHKADYIPAVKDAIKRLSSQEISEERKFRVLYKYDPIESKWTLAAFDITPNRDSQFTTNNVKNTLGR